MRLWCVGGPAASAAAAAERPGPEASVAGVAGSVIAAGREKVSSTMRATIEEVMASYAGRMEARMLLRAPSDSKSSRHNLQEFRYARRGDAMCAMHRDLWHSRAVLFVCSYASHACKVHDMGSAVQCSSAQDIVRGKYMLTYSQI